MVCRWFGGAKSSIWIAPNFAAVRRSCYRWAFPARLACGAGADDELAGCFEPILGLELREVLLDLAPCLLALGLAETGEYLVKRAERCALEPHALRCGGHAQRCAHTANLGVGEPGMLVRGFDHA